MDSLEIDGKGYISSREAAKRHSYTTDYVGQLIRGGKIEGKKVGRTWYVEIASLDAYAGASIAAPQLAEPRKDVFSASADKSEVLPTVEKVQTFAPAAVSRKAEDEARSSHSYELLRYVPETDEAPHLPPLAPAQHKPLAHISLNSIVGEEPIEERPAPAEAPTAAPISVEEPTSGGWGWDEEPKAPKVPKSSLQPKVRRSARSTSRGLAFALSCVIALFGLAFGALSVVGVKEIDFKAVSYSASITSIRSLGK